MLSTESEQQPSVLVVGGTGVLGRPVVRALVRDGMHVHVLSRDPEQARRQLPQRCEIHRGDVRSPRALAQAMEGRDAVYVSLSHPFSPYEDFDGDRDGTRLVVEAARRSGVPHLLRLSALGVPEGREDWWVIERKAQADDYVRESGVDFTIFHADWFMETLPVFSFGQVMSLPKLDDICPHWIAAEDFGEQVAVALRASEARNRSFPILGEAAISVPEAAKRFRQAYPHRLWPVTIPNTVLRAMSRVSRRARYLRDIIEHTKRWGHGHTGEATWNELGRPSWTIEQYARSIVRTNDFPQRGATPPLVYERA